MRNDYDIPRIESDIIWYQLPPISKCYECRCVLTPRMQPFSDVLQWTCKHATWGPVYDEGLREFICLMIRFKLDYQIPKGAKVAKGKDTFSPFDYDSVS